MSLLGFFLTVLATLGVVWAVLAYIARRNAVRPRAGRFQRNPVFPAPAARNQVPPPPPVAGGNNPAPAQQRPWELFLNWIRSLWNNPQAAPAAAGAPPPAPHRTPWAFIGILFAAILVVGLSLVLVKKEATVSAPSSHVKAASPSGMVVRPEKVSINEISEALVSSVLMVEYGQESYPWGPLVPDFFNLGDDASDTPEGHDSGAEAWVKINNLLPEDVLRRTKSFDIESQKEVMRYIVALNLQNGRSVDEIIRSWPRQVKGWTTEARIDDPGEWVSCAEYSDSLAAEYLRTAVGKTGIREVSKLELVAIRNAKAYTWATFFTGLGISVALALVIFLLLYFSCSRRRGLWLNLSLWAIPPTVVFFYAVLVPVIAHFWPNPWPNRTPSIYIWAIFLGAVTYLVLRHGYDLKVPKLPKR